jgi:hypothetical protein
MFIGSLNYKNKSHLNNCGSDFLASPHLQEADMISEFCVTFRDASRMHIMPHVTFLFCRMHEHEYGSTQLLENSVQFFLS